MKHIRAITIVIEYEQKVFDEAVNELESIHQATQGGAYVNDMQNRIFHAQAAKENAEAVLIPMKARLKQYCA